MGLYAYQLVAAIDDAKPQFTHVVRGADLLESTHRQRWLQQLLGLEPPSYAHVAYSLTRRETSSASKPVRRPRQ